MIDAIRDSIKGIVINVAEIEFYTQEDPRMNRYFYGKKYKNFRTRTLAVMDDRTNGDMDLLFTTEGLMPVIKGKGKAVIPYDKIQWSKNTNPLQTFYRFVEDAFDNIEQTKLLPFFATSHAFKATHNRFAIAIEVR